MSAPPAKKRKRKEFNPLPWVILVVATLCGAIWFVSRDSKSTRKPVASNDTMEITLAPPPPPPPVTPPPPPENEPPPPEEAEMIEQEVVQDDEPPPEDAAPEPPSDVDLGAGSPGGSGPSIGGGGGGSGSRIGSRRGSGSKFGWYAAKVQSSIREALGRNPSTRSATMSLQVRVWADSNGRIIKAQLVGTSGNPAIDQSIRNQVLTGLQLPQPPPADMPMPINLRITARKPTS